MQVALKDVLTRVKTRSRYQGEEFVVLEPHEWRRWLFGLVRTTAFQFHSWSNDVTGHQVYQFQFKSRELLQALIHIVFNKHSLSTHGLPIISHVGQPCGVLNSCKLFLCSSIRQIRSARALLSWFRIGTVQSPPSRVSPGTQHNRPSSIHQQTSAGQSGSPEPRLLNGVSISLRDQLIKFIIL